MGVYHKMYLPNYGIFDEDRYFKAGSECPVFVINGIHIGVNICEDIWYALGPAAVQREAGAEIIININGSPYHAGKLGFRERMVATRASDNEVYVSYTNLVGGQDELVFDGGSVVFDQGGELVARGKQFEEDLVVVDLDMDAVFRHRLHDPRPRKERPILSAIGSSQVVHVSDHTPAGPKTALDGCIAKPLDPLEETYSALVLGTGDYVRKSGFRKVVIGLSGGIDSSLTATIAADALGSENVLCVAMPSRYSSEGSILDAQALTRNLGIELLTVPIEEAFEAMLHMLSGPFRDSPPNVAEENIQTRVRGNILMALSNKFGWLVLTTGNKSEFATGYANPLWRHGRGIRRDQGRAQDPGVPACPVSKRPRLAPQRNPSKRDREGSQRRTEARPDGPGYPSSLRSPRRDSQGLRGGRPQLRRHSGHGLRLRDSPEGHCDGGPQRVQTPAGPPWCQDHAAGLRAGPASAHSQPVQTELGTFATLLFIPILGSGQLADQKQEQK